MPTKSRRRRGVNRSNLAALEGFAAKVSVYGRRGRLLGTTLRPWVNYNANARKDKDDAQHRARGIAHTNTPSTLLAVYLPLGKALRSGRTCSDRLVPMSVAIAPQFLELRTRESKKMLSSR